MNREQMIAHFAVHGGVPYTHDYRTNDWGGVLFDRLLVYVVSDKPDVCCGGVISSNWHDTPGQKVVSWGELSTEVLVVIYEGYKL